MKLNRKKNTIRNISYGALFKCISILGPFAVRTAILYILGNEYVGLSSLFTSILSFLSLVELGAGSALVYSMYKPIAEDDTKTINALYNLYKKLYRWIGLIILVIGSIFIPFLPKLVKSGMPADVNLYVLYFIYLLNTVLSYWLYAYKQSLLTAFQRSDIISKRSLVIQFCMYIIQIFILYFSKNYYAYIIILPLATIATNIANKIIIDKMFPQYICEGKVSKELEQSIKKKILALFGTKANSIVLHATDNIVISIFLGLSVVGRYGNYFYIMNAISGFLKIIYTSMCAGIGNSLVTETDNKNYKDFETFSFLNSWLVMFCSTCLLCLYQPFMKIWVKERNMFGMDIVCLMVLYFFVYQIRRIVLTYKDGAGIWWEDRFRPYVVMLVNLILNIYLCQVIGLYGIIISTIISMFVAIPWENYTAFKYIFKRSSKDYYKRMAIYIITSFALISLTWKVCEFIPVEGVLGFLIRLVACCVIPNTIWVLFFARTYEYKRFFSNFQKITRRIFHYRVQD